jgi:hypothetical protein
MLEITVLDPTTSNIINQDKYLSSFTKSNLKNGMIELAPPDTIKLKLSRFIQVMVSHRRASQNEILQVVS